MRRLGIGAVVAILCAAWAFPAAGSADVTVGSPLTTPHTNTGFPPGATTIYVQTSLGVPGFRVASPVTGTVVSWSIRGAQSSASTTHDTLRVLRPITGTNKVFGVASSASATFPNSIDDVVRTFPTSLPIKAGDEVGIKVPSGSVVPSQSVPTASFNEYADFADNSNSLGPTTTINTAELLFNASVRPDNEVHTTTSVPNKKKGTSVVTFTLPNPGTVQLKQGATRAQTLTGQAGQLPVTLRLTKKGRKHLLKRGGKSSFKVSYSFTPDFGSASDQVLVASFRSQ